VEPHQIAVGASFGDALIGVAFADIRSKAPIGKVQFVVVGAAHRGRGVAQGLIRALERLACDHGSKRLEAMYSGSGASAATVGHVLAKAGWTTPAAPMLILSGSMRIVEAPWITVVASKAYEIFPWSELSEREASDLAAPAAAMQSWPPELGPFPAEPVELACSVGVRHGGRVVGWMLTHRVKPDLVRYSRLFVDPAHRRRFCGLALVAEALRRQRAAGIPNGLLAVFSANSAMMRIVGRRLELYQDSRTELCYAYKDLV
jgi:GNAT superfamily N-acetyltransferase